MLPYHHTSLAYWRMCDLNKHDHLKRGGSSTGEKWFSWMAADYPERLKTALDILIELGFDVEEGDEGLVVYAYDNKSGQEELFLEAISDLIVPQTGKDKPYIVWRGEDDMVWKDIYGEKTVRSLTGVITFQENPIG